jgi:DNA replication protein DnaC
MEADILVLDELGAQKPTAWVTDVLYLIMNGRYTRRLPTLFTTNFSLEANPVSGPSSLDRMPETTRTDSLTTRIPAALVSRLYEMAQPIEIRAGDFRRDIKMAQHRF